MKQQKKIYDPVRHLWLKALPEEIVRQKLLLEMIDQGFPKSLIIIESSLEAFIPKGTKAQDRRVDILALYQENENLLPLLVIECKASSLCNKSALRQLIGYNSSIGAPFMGLAGSESFTLYWQEKSGLKTTYYLPTYQELTRACKH
ncbi:MAG: type I restriction enzyme HsdR N-terminal domain-containing protein [Chlamydiota bacterium]